MFEWNTNILVGEKLCRSLHFGNCVLDFYSSFCKPHLTLSSFYPSEFLMQKITEDNQIPVHLHVSVSLQYVAGLKGRALVEFFHSNIAEVSCLHQVYKNVLCDLSILHRVYKTCLIKFSHKELGSGKPGSILIKNLCVIPCWVPGYSSWDPARHILLSGSVVLNRTVC